MLSESDSPVPKVAEKQKKNEKRLRILAAAKEVLSEKGIEKSTITEIASKSGVVDSIIYHYFKNKEDLVYYVLGNDLEQLIAELEFQFSGISDPVSRLGKMVWYHLYFNDHSNTRTRKHMLLECRSKTTFQQHKSYKLLLKYGLIMDEILQEGIGQGVLRNDINVKVVRSMIFGLLDEASLLSSLDSQPRQNQTLPDFAAFMSLIMAMIEKSPSAAPPLEKSDKAARILNAAKKLVAAKGFSTTTMGEIAQLADVAEGTIYEYFQNKEDLLLSICKVYFQSNKEKLDRTFIFDNALTKLRQLMWNHFAIFAADGDLVKVFLNDIKFHQSFYTTDTIHQFVDYHGKIIEVLAEGRDAGLIRSDIEDRIFRSLIIGSISNLYARWYLREPLHPLVCMDEMNHFIDLLCRAVAAPEA